jgi:hypothetical protein
MIRFFVYLVMLTMTFAAPARASPVPISTFNFFGDCSDCTGQGHALLTLSGYTLGTAVNTTNFVSLTYAGSNLIGPFTITNADIVAGGSVSGEIGPPLPGAYNLFLFDNSSLTREFISNTGGFWCAGISCNDDFGGNGVWSVATSVPEPASVALLAAGVVGLGAIRRKQARAAGGDQRLG